MLPAEAAEAGRLASALPLALYKNHTQPSGWSLMAVCGREQRSNAMVDGKGQWVAPTLPDSCRYLPFSLKMVGGGKAIPAIDPSYAGGVLLAGEPSVPLYDREGHLHAAARARVDFLVKHQSKVLRTQKILSALSKAGLLVPLPEAVVQAGELQISGLHTINEERLSQLDDELFLSLRKAGALAVAYSCLQSLYQVRNLSKRDRAGVPTAGTAVQTMGDLDLEFMNDDETIKFGPLQ